jgi:hypothetical protein
MKNLEDDGQLAVPPIIGGPLQRRNRRTVV